MDSYDIMAAVEQAIQGKYPGEPVFWDNLPKDFQRPSFTLECQKAELKDVSIGLVQNTTTVLVTCYMPVDVYGDVARKELTQRQDSVAALFGAGGFPVGDRFPHVQANRGIQSPDVAEITVIFSWMEQRPGYKDPEARDTAQAPLMEHYELNGRD